jgi:hypothetical protein
MDSYYYDAGAAAFIGIIVLISFIVGIAGYVLGSLFLMKIFDKAGVQGKWRAWVPVYNTMIFFKLGDLSPWLVLYGIGGTILLSWIGIGAIFSIALAVLSLLAAWRIGLKLQKDAVWVVLYFFLAIVWLGINAFDKSRWNPNIVPASWASNGFLGDRTVWDGIPAQPSAAAPQGYGAAPQGYAPPAPQGYAPPAPQGYAPPAQPGYAPPAAPATGAPVPPVSPTTPPAPPAAPPAAPTTPPAPPAAPPAAPTTPPADPTQPPA